MTWNCAVKIVGNFMTLNKLQEFIKILFLVVLKSFWTFVIQNIFKIFLKLPPINHSLTFFIKFLSQLSSFSFSSSNITSNIGDDHFNLQCLQPLASRKFPIRLISRYNLLEIKWHKSRSTYAIFLNYIIEKKKLINFRF